VSRRRRERAPVLVSAHRCGAGTDRSRENSRAALDDAVALGVEYVEFDVQRLGCGSLVLLHDDEVEIEGRRVPLGRLTLAELRRVHPDVLGYEEVLRALAGRAMAHVDLKFTSPPAAYDVASTTHEVAAARLAVELLGVDAVVVTTLEDDSVRAVRDWADAEGLDLLVGLSLGRSVRGLPVVRQVRTRWSELRPHLRLTGSRANLVVAKHTLARLGVAAYARRRGLPLLVWTVDTERSLRYWMRPGRAWLVTSNEPALALRVRDAGRAGPEVPRMSA
jgi:glycerophosphoryl diester phosphodiesterase